MGDSRRLQKNNLNHYVSLHLTLFSVGGHSVSRFHRVRARLTKTHDFVPFHNWKVQEKPFFEFFLKIFENWTSKILGGPRAWREKLKKLKKNQIFSRESYFYWLNLFCICSQLSFEVYSSSVAQNFKFQIFLAWKIRFFDFRRLAANSSKIILHRGLFLVSMES